MPRVCHLILLGALLTACSSASAEPVINLSDLRPLPESQAGDVLPLRVAIAAVISPKGTALSYQLLLDYLGARLGRPVELVQRRTYAEINDLVESGYVDLAFVCTSAYVAAREEFGAELLVAPQVNGETVYYSLLIVPAGSRAQRMADLRGVAFAFTDPMSTTGRMYPTFLVQQLGSTPDAFFSRTFFTYSHDDAIRAVAPLTPEVKVFGQTMAMGLEAVLLGLAEKMGLSGFGAGGMGDAGDLTHPDHLYLKMVANLAFGEKEDGSDAVPDADAEERRLFEAARGHLPKSVFDVGRWKGIVGEALWPKVVYVLNRGGRFQAFDKAYKGTQVANKYGRLINIYQEKTYGVKSAMTGKHLTGYGRYVPGPFDVTGKPIADGGEYDLRLITYREIVQTKSRTSGNYWLLALLPENFVLMNAADAAARGLRDGDRVKVVSASNPEGAWQLTADRRVPMIGKVKTTQGLRPGVIGFSLGFGHFAYGGVDFTVDGVTVPGDARRIRGIHAKRSRRPSWIRSAIAPSESRHIRTRASGPDGLRPTGATSGSACCSAISACPTTTCSWRRPSGWSCRWSNSSAGRGGGPSATRAARK